jgi:hypothetical protein
MPHSSHSLSSRPYLHLACVTFPCPTMMLSIVLFGKVVMESCIDGVTLASVDVPPAK